MEIVRIALCEDDAVCQAQTMDLVNKWLCAHPAFSGIVTAFDSSQALLNALDQGARFHLYLLDVLMPGLNGIQLGEALRSREESGEIIYLTSTADFAVDSYGVGAFYYLLKPAEKSKLFAVLDKAAARLELRRGAGIIVPTAEGNRRILLDDILYVEKAGRRVLYVCVGETVESLSLQTSFREAVRSLTADRQFCPCGASFVLNLQRVKMVRGQTATLTGGVSVTLPRTACAEFKRIWGDYWLSPRGGR